MFCLLPVKKLSRQSDVVPLAQQPLAQVRADEPGAAGDQDSHGRGH